MKIAFFDAKNYDIESFEKYKGSAKRIAFVSYHSLNQTASSSGVYIDDILIESEKTKQNPTSKQRVKYKKVNLRTILPL